MTNVPITVARGDGIGPEIMAATLHILNAAGARLDIEEIDIGEKVYLAGNPAGIAPESWESLRRTKVFLKAPITTPQGGGFSSLNVAVRKTLGLYANIRPCVSYHPFVQTKHPVMDVVIVRENEEDTYAGIEYRQTDQVEECLKLISRPGSEKIGEKVAMFEAIHGSAPRRAGQNLANPSGLFLGSILMLVHINQPDIAELAHNAWLATIEDGVHTYDMYKEGVSTQKVGTKEFADAVVARLGQMPETLKPVRYAANVASANGKPIVTITDRQKKELVGVDV